MKKHLIFLLTLLIVSHVYSTKIIAQEVILKQNVELDTVPKKIGQNLKKYSHFYIGMGAVVGSNEGEGGDLNYGRSLDFTAGFRYKYKINNVYAIGMDAKYNWTSFNLKQNDDKILPNNLQHKREVINFNNFGFIAYNRFNFDKNRGNHIGKFLDIGAYADWTFMVRHKYTTEFDVAGNANQSVSEVTNSGLLYVERLNYGLTARLGFGKFVFYGSYRLSDQFKKKLNDQFDSSNYPELARFIAGIQISLHD